jgi:hypothetical protein
MKKVIILIIMLSCGFFKVMSETTDSLKVFKSNEIGFGVIGMNNLFSSDYILSSTSINYKRRFNHVSLRFGFYNYDNESSPYSSGYNKLNDSMFSITSYKLDKYFTGFRIGIERDIFINENLFLFCGADLNMAYIKQELTSTFESYKSNLTNNPVGVGTAPSNIPGWPNGINHGYEYGINPVVGATQSYTPFISTTLEFNVFAYYSKIENQDSFYQMNANVKLILDFSF